MKRSYIWVLAVLTLAGAGLAAWAAGVMPVLPPLSWGDGLPLNHLELPSGFEVQELARVPGARSLVLSEKGTLFVGTRGDKVYAVERGGSGTAGKVRIVASGLRQPNGVAFKDGALWIAAVDKVFKLPGIEDRLADPPQPQLVTAELPGDEPHGWRYARFGPDGRLYIAVGAPCNVCERPDPYATILRMDAAGGYEVFARGIRNSVGFAWRPSTGVLWFTNNGRDWMGDNEPPDSLNRAPAPGLNFGFPYCHSGTPDPEYSQGKGCGRFAPPARKLPAHVAALGMCFYDGKMFPARYRGGVFIAEHGSWNRSAPVGYKVSFVPLKGEKAAGYQDFATGWLSGVSAWGRPVDLLVDRTGALLLSDDRAGVIYRITYKQ